MYNLHSGLFKFILEVHKLFVLNGACMAVAYTLDYGVFDGEFC